MVILRICATFGTRLKNNFDRALETACLLETSMTTFFHDLLPAGRRPFLAHHTTELRRRRANWPHRVYL